MSLPNLPSSTHHVLVLIGLDQSSSMARISFQEFQKLLNSEEHQSLKLSALLESKKFIWVALHESLNLQFIQHWVLQAQSSATHWGEVHVFCDAKEAISCDISNESVFTDAPDSPKSPEPHPSPLSTSMGLKAFDPFQFDTLVCFDVLKKAPLLKHFNALSALLKPKARLLIFNDCTSDPSLQMQSRIHAPLLSNIHLLAPRLGFIHEDTVLLPDLLNQGQTGHEALSSLEDVCVLNAYAQWRSLNTPPFETEAKMPKFSKKGPISQAKEDSMESPYVIKLCFEGHNAMQLRYLNEEDQLSFETLFEHCFEHVPTQKLWDYKFNTTRGHSLGLFQKTNTSSDSTLVAHYGGIKRDILFKGTPHVALQIGDVMVNSSVINSLARKGPFFQIASTFLEEHIGYGKDALLGFGFPNQKAMKVASLLGLYSEVDQIKELAYKATDAPPPFWLSCTEIHHHNSISWSSTLNRLWEKMRQDLKNAILGVRDVDYLLRRYFHRPGKTYRLLLLRNRFTRQAKGLMVFNVDPSRFELIDLICPLSNIDLLIQAARFESKNHPSKTLLFRITQTYAKLFMSQDAQLRDLDIRVPANTWTQGPDIEDLNNRWWLTSGDMDFV